MSPPQPGSATVERPGPAQARLVASAHGLVPESTGWFVLNAADARWSRSEAFGDWCRFESAPGTPGAFEHLGLNLHVLELGQASCYYHAESGQEGFLVLEGSCIAVIEGEERLLRRWDYLHCPPGTAHVFVGAGEGPCLLLMAGARREPRDILYEVSEAAGRHGGSVDVETPCPAVAYARIAQPYEIPARVDILRGGDR